MHVLAAQQEAGINWPEIWIGFVLGVVVSVIFWLIEHARSKRSKRVDVGDQWEILARTMEPHLWAPPKFYDDSLDHIDHAGTELRKIAWSQPLDTWRKVLGEADFIALDETLNAYDSMRIIGRHAEQCITDAALPPAVAQAVRVQLIAEPEAREDFRESRDVTVWNLAEEFRQDPEFAKWEERYLNARHMLFGARRRFINRMRLARSARYSEEQDRRQRATVRRDYLRHPIKTYRREAHNREVRKANPWPS